MPEPRHDDARSSRTAEDRAADHSGIDRLSAELLPALIAKLGATGLGELEVREGGWRVRLRRPASGGPQTGSPGSGRERRPTDRAAGGDRHAGGDRIPHAAHHADPAPARSDSRVVATSPAVGIYRPRTDLTVGDRVRSGDRLGAVDMLGVAQEVLAPIDGLVGSSLAASGDAVEFGQELLVVEAVPAGTSGTVRA